MSATDALQDAPETLPAHIEPDEPSYSRLTNEHRRKILVLHDEGLTQAQIAQHLGIHQTSVSRVIRTFATDATDLARRYAKATAYRTLRRVVDIAQKGKDGDAVKAAKVQLEVAELTGAAQGVSVGVQVVIGMPGQPAGPTLSDVRVVSEPAETLSNS